MNSFEKTDSSVKEWGIVDCLADNGSPWFIVGKNGKAQKPSQPTNKPQEAKKVNSFNLFQKRTVFEDSITKNMRPSAIANCDEKQAVNYSASGSKVRDVYEQLRAFKKDHDDASIKSIIILAGTNHLLRYNPVDVANKICRLMIHTSKEFPNTSINFSAILLSVQFVFR